jgi:hypothetical protein
MKNNWNAGLWLGMAALWSACGGSPETAVNENPPAPKEKRVPAKMPDFNADSAYAYTAAQVAFGPRVPNTPAHVKCGDYLIASLKRFGAEVVVQPAVVTAHTGESLKIRNIVGRLYPQKTKRLMICAHWDTRPKSDRDTEKPEARFDGAVDGAASAGIMLELARSIQSQEPEWGLDLVFFDAEDYGNPSDGNTYCLGSQYFAAKPPIAGFKPEYGILLDMVAARNATFFREGYSMDYASDVMLKVWDIAAELGYQNTFVPENSGAITDDHYFVNTILGVKTIDIIHHDPSSQTGFGSYWHTQNDNMEAVDKGTMAIVGKTLMAVYYSEKAN